MNKQELENEEVRQEEKKAKKKKVRKKKTMLGHIRSIISILLNHRRKLLVLRIPVQNRDGAGN